MPKVIKLVKEQGISDQTDSLIMTLNVVTEHLIVNKDKSLSLKLLFMIS